MDRIPSRLRWEICLVIGLLLLGSTADKAPSQTWTPPFLQTLVQMLPGWTFGGDLDLSVSTPLWGWKAGEGGAIHLAFKNVGFSNAEESMLGDALAGSIHLEAESLPKDEVRFHAEIVLEAGEVLLNRYYTPIGPESLRVDFLGTWNPGERAVTGMRGNLRWGETVQVSWEGSFKGLGGRLEGELRADIDFPSVGRLFDLLIVQPLADTQPTWKEVRIRGRSRAQLRVQAGAEALQLNGRLYLQKISMDFPAQQVSIGRLQGEIPFDLPVTGEHEMRPGVSPAFGEVELQQVAIGGHHWPQIELPLKAQRNRLELIKSLNLPIYQGGIRFEGMEVRRILPFPPTIALGLVIEEVDLGSLSKALTPFEIPGKLQGEFPQVLLEAGDIRSLGGIELQLWGGRINMKDLWGEMIFSKRRRLGFEINLRDLDMERATSDLPFGQMGGILEGEVRNLTFSFGQPESFELWVRSVPTRGVKQYVDAKAVENLSILSSGMSAPLLPWFKKYPYSRLGIYCKLKNDVFSLRGTIIEDDTEYLVKRAFLRGINVINRNPKNRIPWRDMVQRIHRILSRKGDKVRVRMGTGARQETP